MKKVMVIMALVMASVFGFMPASSQATLSAPTLTISGNIWVVDTYGFGSYDLSPTGLFSGLGPAAAQFTVDAINFTTNGGYSTYNQFLSNSLTGAPGLNDLVWSIGSTSFGNLPVISDSTYSTFIQLTGTAYFPQSFTITKDDGFWLQVGNQVFNSFMNPTSADVCTINLASAGIYTFTLDYSGWNGFPEVLQSSAFRSAVPIPPTAYLLVSGLIPFIRLRKKGLNLGRTQGNT